MKNRKALREKILKGIQIAIDNLISASKKNDGYIVVSENGKVIKIKARDLK